MRKCVGFILSGVLVSAKHLTQFGIIRSFAGAAVAHDRIHAQVFSWATTSYAQV